MTNVILACQFCETLNRIDVSRQSEKPVCSECKRPFLLDRPVKVSEEHFDKTVLESEVPVLVDFYADWCAPCRVMAPVIDEIARENSGRLLVAKVDTDQAPRLSKRYAIRSIPFFARFENGEMVRTVIGTVKDELKELAA